MLRRCVGACGSRGSGIRGVPGSWRHLGLALSLVVVGVAPVWGQETGSITGRVVNAVTSAPVPGAQVYVEGTQMGTLSRADGRFLLLNVPAGTHTVAVEIVGFSRAREVVTVTAGQTSSVTLRVREEAIALDQIVVTGLPTEARRREIGASLNQINAAELEAQPIPNVEALLQASGPGVLSLINQGQVGASGALQLRGPTSVSQGNEPLVYIDGVRVSTNRTPPGAAFDGRNTRVSGFTWNDVNLADVDRVEIIKGAAATALYGTEASGGVIQIFTKRGTSGRPQWSFSVTQGANFWPTPSEVIRRHETSLDIDVVKRTGWVQRYTGSVRGGGQDLSYYISASGSDEKGIVDTQWSKHWSATGNFDIDLSEGVHLQVTNTYTHRRTREVADGNNRYGYMLNVLRVGKGYMAGSRDQSWVLEQEYFKNIDTFLSGATLSYLHAGGFKHTLRLGLHHVESASSGLQPFGWHLNPLGTISERRWQNRLLTAEYTGTWERKLTDAVRSSFSWGGQIFDERNQNVVANGLDFPGPGNHTVSSAARTTGEETEIREVNAGFFFQELVGIQDRLFLTGAVRFDGSSTFGEDYGFQVYPKLSVSYVLSDASFWPRDWWSSFRLRGAVGMAGKAPGAFDARRTWNPISAKGGKPGLSPGNLGNPNLGPEKTTEFEAGFDSDMFGGRLSLAFTYYNSTTREALFEVQPIPSNGFLNAQLENVGELKSQGVELSATAVLIDAERFNWQVGADVSTIDSEITDMGGAAPFSVGRLQFIKEGFAPPAFFGRKVTNPNEKADPKFEDDVFLGNTFPSTTLALRSNLSFGALSVSGVGELLSGGHMVNAVGWLNTIRGVWPGCDDAQRLESEQRVAELTAAERARCLRQFTGADQFVEDADFFKLRNVTVSYRVPDRLLPLGFGSATLSLTGINLFKITDYTGIDPESHQGGGDSSYREDYYTIPPRRSLLARLNVTF